MQIKKKYPNFIKYRKGVFVTRLEMIFKVSNSAPKYMMEDLKNGTKIYFKETSPDCDNLEKLIYDALEDVGVMENDGQICSKNGILKRFGIVPGVIIELEGEV
jgi:Holliday junction resolvase RusA-like endonuclease